MKLDIFLDGLNVRISPLVDAAEFLDVAPGSFLVPGNDSLGGVLLLHVVGRHFCCLPLWRGKHLEYESVQRHHGSRRHFCHLSRVVFFKIDYVQHNQHVHGSTMRKANASATTSVTKANKMGSSASTSWCGLSDLSLASIDTERRAYITYLRHVDIGLWQRRHTCDVPGIGPHVSHFQSPWPLEHTGMVLRASWNASGRPTTPIKARAASTSLCRR